MIYTDSGKYAIRAITRLASLRSDGATMTAGAIAKAEGNIPPAYLAKILQALARAGLLQSVRGRGGGFRLARPADKIRAIEVLNVVESLARRAQMCILALDHCSDINPCPLHDTWKQFRTSALTYLQTLTVADLAEARERKGSTRRQAEVTDDLLEGMPTPR
jgi:Rrf2 family protein